MTDAKKQGGKGLRAGETARAQGPTRRSALAALAGMSAMALTGHAHAQDPAPAAGDQSTPRRAEGADLQLVLAVDASGSVNARRFRLQQMGYADAFRNQRVIKAISSGMWGAIAVTMFQWTGPHLQAQTVGWTRLASEKDCRAFGDFLEMSERHLFGGGTSISGAIDHGVELFGSCPWKAPRRVIDVSGDGYNSSGRDVAAARDEAVKRGVIINGLPILALEYDLDEHFRKEVIGGPGSFMISARTFEAFGEAVTRKLVQEIAGAPAPRARRA